jgi:hypothetical protein
MSGLEINPTSRCVDDGWGGMDDFWTIIGVVWLLAFLLAAIRVVRTNHDVWAGFGVTCLGLWIFAAGWAIKWLWW